MSNLKLAEEYYLALGNKNIEGMERYLHEDVFLISPLAEVKGREAVLEAASQLTKVFQKLEVRAKFADGSQVMMAHTLSCPEPMGEFRSAVLLTFKNALIAQIELFYDGRPIRRYAKTNFW